jgi:hypothetical protein
VYSITKTFWRTAKKEANVRVAEDEYDDGANGSSTTEFSGRTAAAARFNT